MAAAGGSATTTPTPAGPGEALAYGLGFLGVVAFSLTLPMTRLAVLELPAEFVAFGRLALAGAASVPVLLAFRAPWPTRAQLRGFLLVIGGVVWGFPVLTTLALRHVDSSHGAVVLTVLPLMTAAAGALLAGERPRARFWLWAGLGAASVLGFALTRSRGTFEPWDLVLLAACACSAAGYAAGAALARAMPGLAVIAWALVLSLPVAAPLAWLTRPADPAAAGAAAWGAFAYVALGSQLLGFLFWYRGLALGGVAKVGQVQLLQTFLTLGFGAWILGERPGAAAWGFAAVTLLCVWQGRRVPAAGRGGDGGGAGHRPRASRPR